MKAGKYYYFLSNYFKFLCYSSHIFCLNDDLLYMPENQQQISDKIEDMQRMEVDAILATWR